MIEAEDSQQELRLAASWAAQELHNNPQQRIGIVVPELNNSLQRVARVVNEALNSVDNNCQAHEKAQKSLPISQLVLPCATRPWSTALC